jgi:hypothetical protein
MKRPLLRVVLLYSAGVLTGHFLSLPLLALLAPAIAFAMLAMALPAVRAALLYPLIFLTGLTNLTLHTAALSPNDLRRILGSEAHLLTVRGKLTETPTIRVYEQDENRHGVPCPASRSGRSV